MKRLVLMLVLPIILAAAPDKKQDKDRVRAAEPTVVTVREPKQKNFGQKVGGAVRTGATKTWNAIVGFGGWMLNTDDDIPSERERRRRAETDDVQQRSRSDENQDNKQQ